MKECYQWKDIPNSLSAVEYCLAYFAEDFRRWQLFDVRLQRRIIETFMLKSLILFEAQNARNVEDGIGSETQEEK